jgi:hypothetical protein
MAVSWRLRLGILILAVLAAAGLASCAAEKEEPTGPSAPRVASVEVTPAVDTLESFGSTQQFSATALDAGGVRVSGQSFTWVSSGTGVARVDSAGLATAAGNGSAAIVATTSGVSGTAALTVAQRVSTVEVSVEADTMTELGALHSCSAVAKDAGGSPIAGQTFTWSSSDTLVATVSSQGRVTTVGEGIVTITAALDGVSGSVELVVSQTPTTVEIAPATIDVFAGDSLQLVATVRDAGGYPISGSDIVWSIDDTSVATISDSGMLTGLTAGTATVSAGADTITGTAPVLVSPPPIAIAVLQVPDTVLTGDVLSVEVVFETWNIPHDAGAIVLTLRFNSSQLLVDDASYRDIGFVTGSIAADEVKLVLSEPLGIGVAFTAVAVRFTVLAAAGTDVALDLEVDQLISARTFQDITSSVLTQDLTFTVR